MIAYYQDSCRARTAITIGVLLAAATTLVAQDLNRPIGRSSANRFEAIAVRTLPNLQCNVRPTDSPSSASVPVATDDDGYARFHAVRPTRTEDVQRLTLSCTDTGGTAHFFPVDLSASDTFDAHPLEVMAQPGKDRPALTGDPRQYTQQQLTQAGYGLRPDPANDPAAYGRWLKATAVAGRELAVKRNDKLSHQPHTVTETTAPWWVGSVLTGRPDYVSTEVLFNVPTAVPGGDYTTTTEISIWNGLGGYNSGSGLIQGGVNVYTTPTTASYGSWREYCCGDPYSNGYGGAFAPNPGDQIYSQSWYCDATGALNLNGGYGCTYVADLNSGAILNCTNATGSPCWSVPALPLCSASPTTPNCMTLGTSAEFIIENQSPQVSSSSTAFTDFTPQITMSGTGYSISGGNAISESISSDPNVFLLKDFTDTTTRINVGLASTDTTFFHVAAGAKAWNQFELSSACAATANGAIKSVSRIPNSMEVWWICSDGSVWDAYFYDGMTEWGQFQLSPPGSASVTGGLTAVSRKKDTMEIWWVRPDGGIQDAYWYEGMAGWNQYSLAGPGTASLTGGLAAVSRAANAMELWWTAPDGSVGDAYWYEGMPHFNQYQLWGPGSASVNGKITAVSRASNAMELWWIRADGGVQDSYWYDGMQHFAQFELAGPDSASTEGAIAAVSRQSNTMELWWIRPDGGVQDAFFYNGGQWNQFQLSAAGSASSRGGLTAVARQPSTMEVWWIRPDGGVQDANWYEGSQWDQIQISGAGSASLTGGITSVARQQGAMEVWWTRSNGGIQDGFVYQSLN